MRHELLEMPMLAVLTFWQLPEYETHLLNFLK
jgi:hypothetical protein